MSYKSVPQEFPTRVTHKSVLQECPTRVSFGHISFSSVFAFGFVGSILFFNRTGGFEPGKSSSAERRLRDGLGSWSDHVRIVPPLWLEFSLVSCSADFVAGAALCEPACADVVAGAALCELRGADFVAGTALCEPSCADFVAGAIQNAFSRDSGRTTRCIFQ